MLIGPSRAGKTPLSFYLAQRGYKAGNGRVLPRVLKRSVHVGIAVPGV